VGWCGMMSNGVDSNKMMYFDIRWRGLHQQCHKLV
jgi:hypothetical protein